MARLLRYLSADLGLDPIGYVLRDAATWPGDLPRLPTRAAVEWELGGPWVTARGSAWTARATLPAGVVDTTPIPTERTATTPLLAAAGLRAWTAVELVDDADAALGTSVVYRLVDGGGHEWWWTGSAWADLGVAPGSGSLAKWNTASDIAARFPTWWSTAHPRALRVRAWLRTTSRTHAPTWYGARVVYGVRDQGDEDDALIRTLVAHLRADLTATAVARLPAPTATGGPPAVCRVTLGRELSYRTIDAVAAVYDLTADPDERTALAGTWAAPVWTFTAAPTAGHTLLFEVRYRPEVVVSRHRDVATLEHLPAVYLAPDGAGRLSRGQGREVVLTRAAASPPSGLEADAAGWVDQPLQVRAVAELTADARRLSDALRAWVVAHPCLVSAETGRIVEVREVQPFVSSFDGLAQGVAEVRGRWSIGYTVGGRPTVAEVPHLRAGGLDVEDGG